MFPLQSIRVLDLSRLLPGPFCTMLLADFGAEVIKIEAPELGDYARHYEPKIDENSVMFHSLNRNKKSVTLDLKTDEGKDQFLQMVGKADVVVESFRPGVMKRLGLDFPVLEKINPRLIYCAISGYGQTGPYAEMPGHDINYISFAGLLELMGEKDGKPIVPAVQVADLAGGAYPAVTGILLALLEREKSGKGQFIDISMMDGVISLLQSTLPNYLMKNIPSKRGEQMLSGGLACYEVYQTKDGRWLAVGALEMKFWRVFCQKIGKPEWIALLNEPDEVQYKLKHDIQTVMYTKTLAEWMDIFEDAEACVSPVLNFAELVNHPQVQARKMFEAIEQDGIPVKHIGIPIKLSRTPGKIRAAAPKLGEHTEYYLNQDKS
ncbi:CoA transferase [Caldibacillus thermoamylovorans]|uniref:CaiB/BaiF CoA transferase family protein n=1 Tax=Caldibacillus thermoamylovorans TaxID=35841 RepID=UPI001D06BB92|nr:CaiB/BaiF CoA-transferase family protein [Caldibacillus thermoamylovorans]MCB5934543.1 CoA transferase [Bacillus sp. DFI.2.34]MCB7077720.1 CoA transferase [Caldibacillus thermoamylovorans]